MKLRVSFKHLEHTPALDDLIKDKSERLRKHLKGNFSVQWICGVNENQHCAEVMVKAPRGQFFAKAASETMYKSVDMVLDKVERQLEKQKTSRLHMNEKKFDWNDIKIA